MVTDNIQAMDHYRLLGRSALRVSPLALGGASFGTAWGYGADSQESRRIFDAYLDHGGNFIDTANVYTNGESERLIGEFSAGRRERLVIATKFAGGLDPGDANAAGNSRKTMMRSVEDSLRRLKTDYIDLYYLHAWDNRAHPDEVMRGFDDLVRSGKVVYVGISDTPAWQIARMQTLADLRGWSPLVALQLEYSLVRRDSERELLPMAKELGLGVTTWWTLAGGLLTGKYKSQISSENIDSKRSAGVMTRSLSAANLRISEAVCEIADEIDKTPAQVALAWACMHPAVTAPIIGARTTDQLISNLGCLGVRLEPEHMAKLQRVTDFDMGFPHDMLASEDTQQMFVGSRPVEAR